MKTILSILLVCLFSMTNAQDTLIVSMTETKNMKIFLNQNRDILFAEIVQDNQTTCKTQTSLEHVKKMKVVNKGHAYVMIKTVHESGIKRWKCFHCEIMPEPYRPEPRPYD